MSNRLEKNSHNSEQLVLPLDEGIRHATDHILKLHERLNGERPVIVTVGGGTSSGKTSQGSEKLAQMLRGHIAEGVTCIPMDNWYRTDPTTRERIASGEINFDHPDAVDLDRLAGDISRLRNGKAIEMNIYGYAAGILGQQTVHPNSIILVEGLFVLSDEFESMSDYQVAVESSQLSRMIRRFNRDYKHRGVLPQENYAYWAQIIGPMHEQHVQPTFKNADLVLLNEYNVDVEQHDLPSQEYQQKFLLPEQLEQRNAILTHFGVHSDMLGLSCYTDLYYEPKERVFSETGESLRVRTLTGALGTQETILTYKGPIYPTRNGGRQRSTFKFPIPTQQADYLDTIANRNHEVSTYRRLYNYQLQTGNHVTVCLDEVSAVDYRDLHVPKEIISGMNCGEIRSINGLSIEESQELAGIGLLLDSDISELSHSNVGDLYTLASHTS